MAETLEQNAWRRGFVCSAPVTVATLLLAGCSASAPVTSYQPPVPQQNYPATVNVPNDWTYSNGGYYAPPRPAPAAPALPSYFPNVIPRAEAHTTPEPYRPEPAAPEPVPLRPVDPPDSHPVDPSCGWYRLCNFWSGGS
jgi:hypothetical protein